MILVVDIGSSSLRAMFFDMQARVVEGTRVRRSYSVRTTGEGGAELGADEMFEAFATALDEVLKTGRGTAIDGVAASSLATNILAVDREENALTPAYLYSDTRDVRAVEDLRTRVDWEPIYARTGCPLHTSYLPARFLWLKQTQPDLFARTYRWVSLHEYFLLKLFGRSIVSHSLASWTGLLNRSSLDWDDRRPRFGWGSARTVLAVGVGKRCIDQTSSRVRPALAGAGGHALLPRCWRWRGGEPRERLHRSGSPGGDGRDERGAAHGHSR